MLGGGVGWSEKPHDPAGSSPIGVDGSQSATSSTSWGSLVRAQYRPLTKPLQKAGLWGFVIQVGNAERAKTAFGSRLATVSPDVGSARRRERRLVRGACPGSAMAFHRLGAA
jgi:hypothetical protein